ncbi:hypothetical protein [Burkholderia sp. BCC0405]|uniref:hypothetical protein n=1 Tax=Burkholderia sp. BCC0405 TaxID=2676298 RepID=UPI00158E6C75|nr:hypothetical protein [Burkholderia sp. BCC0405]
MSISELMCALSRCGDGKQMNRVDCIAALKVAQDAGCQLVVGVPVLGGSSTMPLTPKEAYRLTTDKQALFAALSLAIGRLRLALVFPFALP